MDDVQLVRDGHTLKIIVSTGLSAFLIGAIFWAGAIYNRFDSMEKHVSSIDMQITALSGLPSDLHYTNERQAELQKRVDKLEETVRQLR